MNYFRKIISVLVCVGLLNAQAVSKCFAMKVSNKDYVIQKQQKFSITQMSDIMEMLKLLRSNSIDKCNEQFFKEKPKNLEQIRDHYFNIISDFLKCDYAYKDMQDVFISFDLAAEVFINQNYTKEQFLKWECTQLEKIQLNFSKEDFLLQNLILERVEKNIDCLSSINLDRSFNLISVFFNLLKKFYPEKLFGLINTHFVLIEQNEPCTRFIKLRNLKSELEEIEQPKRINLQLKSQLKGLMLKKNSIQQVLQPMINRRKNFQKIYQHFTELKKSMKLFEENTHSSSFQ